MADKQNNRLYPKMVNIARSPQSVRFGKTTRHTMGKKNDEKLRQIV